MASRWTLNMELVAKARASASQVADDVQEFIDAHTTVTVERAVCRLLGIDGINDVEVPLPNVVVDHLQEKGILSGGAAYYLGCAMAEHHITPQQAAERITAGELDLSKVPPRTQEEVRRVLRPAVDAAMERITKNVTARNDFLKEFGDKEGPYLYIIVATGNIYEDITQAKAGAKQGADIIAVIRTTGQSLLDYVPYGATTEGFGGTYGRGGPGAGPLYPAVQLLLRPVYARDRRHGGPGAAGRDAQRRAVRHPVPGYQYAAHHH